MQIFVSFGSISYHLIIINHIAKINLQRLKMTRKNYLKNSAIYCTEKIHAKCYCLVKNSSREPLAGMHWSLVWSVLRTRRFEFVQMKSRMTTPQCLNFYVVIYMETHFFSRTAASNGTILSMNHPLEKDVSVCSNKVPGVTNGQALRGHLFSSPGRRPWEFMPWLGVRHPSSVNFSL